jgi:protein-tyrosine phosphatase
MHHAIKEKRVENQIHVDSCGTSSYHLGDSPDERTIRNARENNILLNHQARQFSEKDFVKFDYILAMDASNFGNIRLLDPDGIHMNKVKLLRDYDIHAIGSDVPDPYFGGEEGFKEVFDIVHRSVHEFLDYLIKKYELKSAN